MWLSSCSQGPEPHCAFYARGQSSPSQTHFLHFLTSAGHKRGIEIVGLCCVIVRAASRLHNCTRQRSLRKRKSRHHLSRCGACETASCVAVIKLQCERHPQSPLLLSLGHSCFPALEDVCSSAHAGKGLFAVGRKTTGRICLFPGWPWRAATWRGSTTGTVGIVHSTAAALQHWGFSSSVK